GLRREVGHKAVAVNCVTKDGVLDQVMAFETEIEFWSKDTAIKHLGEYLKLFKENRADDDQQEAIVDDDLRAGVISILRDAKKRRDAALVLRPSRSEAPAESRRR